LSDKITIFCIWSGETKLLDSSGAGAVGAGLGGASGGSRREMDGLGKRRMEGFLKKRKGDLGLDLRRENSRG